MNSPHNIANGGRGLKYPPGLFFFLFFLTSKHSYEELSVRAQFLLYKSFFKKKKKIHAKVTAMYNNIGDSPQFEQLL